MKIFTIIILGVFIVSCNTKTDAEIKLEAHEMVEKIEKNMAEQDRLDSLEADSTINAWQRELDSK